MGAWIETLSSYYSSQSDYESHPTWVRGLKQLLGGYSDINFLSHPTWVRGLKQDVAFQEYIGLYVASYMGAWIETKQIFQLDNLKKSHPTWVRGLKHIMGIKYDVC